MPHHVGFFFIYNRYCMDNCHLLRDARTFQDGLLLSNIYIIPGFGLGVS